MQVRVGSTKYDFKTTNQKIMIDEEDEAMGSTNFHDAVITVSKNFPKQTRKQTFWHEVVHAIFDELGRSELGYNEDLVDSIGKLIYAFHEDNKLDRIYAQLEC